MPHWLAPLQCHAIWLYSVAMTTTAAPTLERPATPPETIRAATQVLAGFTPGQGGKAIDLITSSRIRHASLGRYRVTGTTGTVYWTTADTCSCPARCPCYHRCAAMIINVARRSPVLDPDAEDGYRSEQADYED